MEPSKNWDDFKKWWVGYLPDSTQGVNNGYDQHPLISPVMNIGNCVIAVIDIKTMKYIYTSPNFSEFLGWNEDMVRSGGVSYAYGQLHPDDVHGVNLFSELINAYFKRLPDELKGYYRCYWDYQLSDKEKKYYKILQQDCALKYSDDGSITELLLFASKIEGIISTTSQHLRITNGKENIFYKYDHQLKANIVLEKLSSRELEVAKLIAKSRSLKEVASDLGISFNTAKTHSANIHEKLKVKDSIEMVNLLRVFGFI